MAKTLEFRVLLRLIDERSVAFRGAVSSARLGCAPGARGTARLVGRVDGAWVSGDRAKKSVVGLPFDGGGLRG
ncbi:hypothetical protein [Streptomyces spiralis]|uniref:hypothetical protein n=1 Tax=Streptomyces spiralis TaxID=66376 RepID=UPI0033F1474E